MLKLGCWSCCLVAAFCSPVAVRIWQRPQVGYTFFPPKENKQSWCQEPVAPKNKKKKKRESFYNYTPGHPVHPFGNNLRSKCSTRNDIVVHIRQAFYVLITFVISRGLSAVAWGSVGVSRGRVIRPSFQEVSKCVCVCVCARESAVKVKVSESREQGAAWQDAVSLIELQKKM